ncbi:MAG: cell division protein ZapA [Candidatus Hinthialibacter antarcticus]|nr:cell division protein ZapA [Candidatus Hinthialibacter antarcticus]
MSQHPDIIQLEIMGTHLQLRGGDDPDAVREAGALVKERIDELVAQAPTAPSLKVVLLVAINLADELMQNARDGSEMDEAVSRANRILDKVSNSSK